MFQELKLSRPGVWREYEDKDRHSSTWTMTRPAWTMTRWVRSISIIQIVTTSQYVKTAQKGASKYVPSVFGFQIDLAFVHESFFLLILHLSTQRRVLLKGKPSLLALPLRPLDVP